MQYSALKGSCPDPECVCVLRELKAGELVTLGFWREYTWNGRTSGFKCVRKLENRQNCSHTGGE